MKSIWTSLLIALLVAACGNDDKKNAPEEASEGLSVNGLGCIQGILMDGVSGEPLAVNGQSGADGIEVIVAPNVLKAAPVNDSSLPGEFLLCGIPLEADFPIIARYGGYQTFHSVVKVHSSHVAQSDRAIEDVPSQRPTAVVNIRVFPAESLTEGYRVHVHHAGQPVAAARVFLQPTGSAFGQPMSGFLTPHGYRLGSLARDTDEAGLATFPAEDLLLGGRYEFKVLPPNGGSELQAAKGTIQVGISTQHDPYELFVELHTSEVPLAVVSSSLQTADFHESGVVTYRFNRPIELVPGSIDGITATLSKLISATLVDNVPGNNEAEQVLVEISQQTMTLTPKFLLPPDADLEAGIAVSMRNIRVRPTTGRHRGVILTLSPTVSLYGGVSPVPSALNLVLGNDQMGAPGTTLALPLVVKLTDQNGVNLRGALLRYSVYGGGSLSETTARTDAKGEAEVFWTIGSAGAQQVIADVAGLSVTFNAIIGDFAVTSGDAQKGFSGDDLEEPVVLTLQDQSNLPVANKEVTIVVDDDVNGGTVRLAGATAGKTLRAFTDSAGKVSFIWTLGTAAGVQTLSATTGELATLSIAATAVLPVMTVVSGNQQTGGAAQPLANPLILNLKDDDGTALASQAVSLSVMSGGGSISSSSVTTDSSGNASFTWTLGSSGQQQVRATFKGQTIDFIATLATLSAASGAAQMAVVGAPLDAPIVFQVNDQNGSPLANVSVTIAVEDTTRGGTIKDMNGGTASTRLTLSTDSVGSVGVEWTMGTTGGTYSLSAMALAGTPVRVEAKAQKPTTITGSGSRSTSLSATVTDQDGLAIKGVTVRFSCDGDGEFVIGGAAAANPALGLTNIEGKVMADWDVANATSASASLPDFGSVSAASFSAP